MSVVEYLLAAALGVSLAAAVGLRVFVPMLVVSVAARFGFMELSPGFSWVGSNTAIAMLAIAAIAEVAAYYVPGLDNVLDALAAPVAVAAGTLMVAVPLGELAPMVKWTAAIVAGGGVAGVTHAITSMLRAKSTLATGGLGNPLVATGELGGSLLLSILALLLPVVALVLLLVGLALLIRLVLRMRRRKIA